MKTIIITGANHGLGFEAAKKLQPIPKTLTLFLHVEILKEQKMLKIQLLMKQEIQMFLL